MATRKITGLTELATTPADDDLVQIIDVSDTTFSANGTNKKIQVSNLLAGAGGGDEFWVAHGVCVHLGHGKFLLPPCSELRKRRRQPFSGIPSFLSRPIVGSTT